ncbi:MAG: glycosyltransferase family 2 protein [Candidatus Limnocylindrales bacterium]
MTQPLVSILTPSYNQGRWLADNLRSVAAQTYAPIEHVVMDGGSTDGSVEILRSASPAVIWESAPDNGQSDAINKAFARSRGEIIGWLNSDDAYFARNVVQHAADVFENHPEVGVVYGHAALVNGAGELLHVLWAPPYTRSRLRTFNFICQPTVFVRRSFISRPFFVDPEFGYRMDLELWLHLADVTLFRRIDEVVAIDRHHSMRKSYTRLDLAFKDGALISARYGLPEPTKSRVKRKVIKVGLRIAGLVKVPEAARGSDILDLACPSAARLAFRQVAQLRGWMPTGDG